VAEEEEEEEEPHAARPTANASASAPKATDLIEDTKLDDPMRFLTEDPPLRMRFELSS
jgi:hypothetical protein